MNFVQEALVFRSPVAERRHWLVQRPAIRRQPLPDLPEKPMEVDPESRVRATPDGNYVLVSAFKWNAVVVVDAATLKPVKTLLVEAEPMHFDFTPGEPDMAFVANHRAGRVSRIDLRSLTVAESFLSAPPPRTGRPESIAFYCVEA